MTRLSHAFSVEHAEAYGIECAILINHFQFWIEQNKAMGRNFHDSRTWMYQTQKEIAAVYPYWSEDAVGRLIKKLVDFGILIKGNYNKSKYDQTAWYAFKNEEIFTIPRNRGLEKATPNLPFREIAEPIPDTIPNTNKIQQQQAAETAAVFSKSSSQQEQQAISLSNNNLQHNINYQPKSSSELVLKNELYELKTKENKFNLNNPAQQSAGNSGQLKIYSNLKDIEIPEQEKMEITNRYSESVVKKAIGWATHPKNPPKKCLTASIKYACKHSFSADEFLPKKKPSILEQIKQYFKHGELYNNAECFISSEYIAFQRGMKHESVSLGKYFSWNKLESLCSSFQITMPRTA